MVVIIITYADIAWKPVFRWKSRLIDHTKLNVISTIKHLSSFTFGYHSLSKVLSVFECVCFTFIIRPAMNYVCVCVCVWFPKYEHKESISWNWILHIRFRNFFSSNGDIHVQCQMLFNGLFKRMLIHAYLLRNSRPVHL